MPRLVGLVVAALTLAGCDLPGAESPAADPEPEPQQDAVAPDPEPQADPEPEVTPPDAPDPDPQPDRLAWVAAEDADELVLVDLDRGEILARHPTPGGPHNIVVADDGTVAAALYGSTELAIVRDGDATFVELGGTPHDVKAANGRFVVANELAERLDIVTFAGEYVASVPLPGQPHDTAVAPDGVTARVTMNRTDRLAVVDLDAAEVVDQVPTGQSPHNILFAPDGDTFWVTDWTGPVHAFSADGTLLETLPVGVEAHHLAFTPDGGEVWVTDHHTHEVFVIDAAAFELTATLTVPGAPHHVNITPDGELAAVADHDQGAVVVYDVAERTEIRTVEVGAGPHGIWVVP